MVDTAFVQNVNEITRRAGRMLAEFFKDPKYRQPDAKGDGSPVTLADKTVSAFLVEELSKLGFPVVSEEDEEKEMIKDQPYFIVDPLDGTKYFARGEKDFAVLVGFLDNNRPVFGAVHEPMKDTLYHGIKGRGAFREDQPIQHNGPAEQLVIFSSGFHRRDKARWLFSELDIKDIQMKGSGLKFCEMAMGKADFFPRFGLTSEWDTAGPQVILEEAGLVLLDLRDGKTLSYGKENRLNRGFVACHTDLEERAVELLSQYVWPQIKKD